LEVALFQLAAVSCQNMKVCWSQGTSSHKTGVFVKDSLEQAELLWALINQLKWCLKQRD